ncbi:MAG: SWIM zinc finger family protein, partial [Desulfobacterales bacterium]
MAYWRYPRYVSVVEKRAKAARKLKQLRKKNSAIQPIVIDGRAIAHTWWGKSWNLNLERYADYSNRIGRGRSYVRHGAVLDLQISPGQVKSLVQGSRTKPYAVIIKIKGIKKKTWQNIKAACAGKLDSLPELLTGKFPKALGEIFTVRGQGLFPSPQEIEFDCSCPDWAYMCKHVAATLYGIGARLDEDPGLFFKLRRGKIDDLIQQTVKDQSYKLLKKAEKKSARVIAESDLSGMFGIDMEENMDFDSPKTAKIAS